MSQFDPEPISCSTGCKRTAPDQEAASHLGWEFLPIQGRWRCSQCWRELRAVNQPKTT